MPNINDTYASVLAAYSGSVNDKRSELLTSILGYAKPLSLNDMEAAALASLGYTGALNDTWDKYIKALGGFGISEKADYLSSTFYGNPVPFLFKASEPGVWYDPSDITTLFTDNAGTTPVTTAGQTVGLILDKSQGRVLGNELVTNGTFNTNTTGWTAASSATLSVSSGSLVVTNGLLSFGYAFQAITTVVGRYYSVSFSVTGGSNTGNLYIGTTSGGFENYNSPNRGVGVYPVVFLATATTTYIRVGISVNTIGATVNFDNISVKSLAGSHATQATLAQRPTYQVDSTGRPYLSFDGVDDGMVTNTITPGTDKVQVFAGVRKLSDAASGVIVESSTSSGTSNGAFALLGRSSSGYSWVSRGTTLSNPLSSGSASPRTDVLTGVGDISGDVATIRDNGVQVATSSADQGTGNFLAYPLYIGRRGGTTLPFNGRLYSLITRFGPNLTTGQITSTETYVNGKTGAY